MLSLFKLFGYYLTQGNCTLAPNSTKAHDKNQFYNMKLSIAHEFIGIQDQPRGTALKYAGFLLLTSAPERTLAEIFSTLSMGGGLFW